MGFLNKLMFWKKKDEFADLGLGEQPAPMGENLGLGELGGDMNVRQQSYPEFQPSPQQSYPGFQPAQQSSQQPFQQQPYQQPYQDVNSKNLEIISSKLDALRASIESINQRLANIEAMARGEEEERHRRRW